MLHAFPDPTPFSPPCTVAAPAQRMHCSIPSDIRYVSVARGVLAILAVYVFGIVDDRSDVRFGVPQKSRCIEASLWSFAALRGWHGGTFW